VLAADLVTQRLAQSALSRLPARRPKRPWHARAGANSLRPGLGSHCDPSILSTRLCSRAGPAGATVRDLLRHVCARGVTRQRSLGLERSVAHGILHSDNGHGSSLLLRGAESHTAQLFRATSTSRRRLHGKTITASRKLLLRHPPSAVADGACLTLCTPTHSTPCPSCHVTSSTPSLPAMHVLPPPSPSDTCRLGSSRAKRGAATGSLPAAAASAPGQTARWPVDGPATPARASSTTTRRWRC